MNCNISNDCSLDEIGKLLSDESLGQTTRITLKFLLLDKANREYVEACVDEFLASLDVQERTDLEGK